MCFVGDFFCGVGAGLGFAVGWLDCVVLDLVFLAPLGDCGWVLCGCFACVALWIAFGLVFF